MLVDFISRDSYNSYNIKLANLWGLDTAVYFSTILTLYSKEKKSDFVMLNREKVKEITTFNKTRQYELDANLKRLNILEVIDKNKIKINFDSLLALFDANKEQITDISNLVKKKRTKADVIKEELKTYILTTNPELRDAYSSWIDAVMAKQGWMSKKSVELGQSLIDQYSNRNLDLALELLNIASINGYRDIQWAINNYEQNKFKKVSNINIVSEPTNNIRLSDDLF